MGDDPERTGKYLEDITEALEQITAKLELEIEAELDIEMLQDDRFYHEVLFRIFDEPVVADEDLEAYESLDRGARLQYLIDYLSKTVLKVELEHINGPNIARGSLADIRNFLQLINEMLNIQEEEEPPVSQPQSREISKNHGKSDKKPQSNDFGTRGTKSPAQSQKQSKTDPKLGAKSPASNTREPKSAKSSSQKGQMAKGAYGSRDIEQQLQDYESSVSAKSEKSEGSKNDSPLKHGPVSRFKTNEFDSGGDQNRDSNRKSVKRSSKKGSHQDLPKTAPPSSQPTREPSQQKPNFSKKSRPEVIGSQDRRQVRKGRSANPTLSSKPRYPILEAIQHVGNDPSLTRVMQNQNLDPQKLQETLQRTSAKYEQLVKDYLKFAEERRTLESSQSRVTGSFQSSRALQILETQMYEKMLLERTSHESRMDALLQRYQRMK